RSHRWVAVATAARQRDGRPSERGRAAFGPAPVAGRPRAERVYAVVHPAAARSLWPGGAGGCTRQPVPDRCRPTGAGAPGVGGWGGQRRRVTRALGAGQRDRSRTTT